MRKSLTRVLLCLGLFAGVAVSLAVASQARAQQSDPPAKLLSVVLDFVVKGDYDAARGALVDDLAFRAKFADLVILRFQEQGAELGDAKSYWIERRVARPYMNDGQGRIIPNTVNVRAIIEYEDGEMWETRFQFQYGDHRWRLQGFRPLARWRDEPNSPD